MRSPRPFAAVLLAAASVLVAAFAGLPATAAGSSPDLDRATAYLVDPANLKDGKYYEPFPGFADLGMTIDGVYALAAAGGHDQQLRAMTEFVRTGGTVEAGGFSVTDWMGIGTDFPSGGAIGKVALLAQATGYDPHTFTGHDLIAALHDVTCAAKDDALGCDGRGNYRWATAVFGQALGIIAQVRAGRAADAADPVAYLLGLRHSDGSFPSLIPPAADAPGDVDSTAIAAMALNLLADNADAAAAVDKALQWIASQQDAGHADGFPGAAGISTNSTALAIQGLSLRPGVYADRIGKAKAFLAGRQNTDGGFDVALDVDGSDLRASTQVVAGLTGISFGTVRRDVHQAPASASADPSPSRSASPAASRSAVASASPSAPEAGHLPTTGSSLPVIIGVGALLLTLGLALVIATRRRRTAAVEQR